MRTRSVNNIIRTAPSSMRNGCTVHQRAPSRSPCFVRTCPPIPCIHAGVPAYVCLSHIQRETAGGLGQRIDIHITRTNKNARQWARSPAPRQNKQTGPPVELYGTQKHKHWNIYSGCREQFGCRSEQCSRDVGSMCVCVCVLSKILWCALRWGGNVIQTGGGQAMSELVDGHSFDHTTKYTRANGEKDWLRTYFFRSIFNVSIHICIDIRWINLLNMYAYYIDINLYFKWRTY